MKTATLTVLRRNEKGKKVRRKGFIPGVVYGRELENLLIKVEHRDMNNVLKQYGERTRVKLNIDEQEETAIIKEVDREPITGKILHVDFQLVAAGEKINWEIPIGFAGRHELESRGLVLQVNLDTIPVSGNASLIPDNLTIEVGDKNHGDTIMVKDLEIHPEIQVLAQPDDSVAVIAVSEIDMTEEESDEEDEVNIIDLIE